MAKRKRSKTARKIILITLVYLLLAIAFLSPFMSIEGANKTLGYIIVGVLTFIYIFILLTFLWDWFKEKNYR